MNRKWISVLLLCAVVPGFAEDDSERAQLSEELAEDPSNPILLMQEKMLHHQRGETAPARNNWRWRQSRSNLQREVLGAMPDGGGRNSFMQSADLLTGQRAIDESLQLGSIGVNRATDDASDSVSIDEIEFVEIASHPWGDMIAGQEPAVPEIARLIPRDVLFVHMSRPTQFLELENILEKQSDLIGDVYGLAEAADLKEKMMRRLGIPDVDAFIAGVDEMAFISEDLSFMPRTDYALVLKPVNALAEKGFDLIVGDASIHRKVGDYIVVATHERLIERIESAYGGTTTAMSNELDYHFALLEMEPRRDGLVYLSEAFIRKLTGPAYRINARRRNTTLDALEALQYSVFAYRRINGKWPASLSDLIVEEYLADKAISSPEDYSIDEQGRVSHSTWGTLWSVVPINQVPIRQVTTAEKTNYERFSAGYQSFFREFFDPVGIAYTISDQLYLHTIILPLIDNSEYRDLASFFGGEPTTLSFLFDAERLGAVNFAARFSVDDMLVRGWGNRRSEPEADETEDARRERIIRAAESEISKELFDETLAEGERLLDFIGDEVLFGIGEDNSFSVSNIADVDLWFGLKINDRERAEAFFQKLWSRLSQQMGGRGMGMLQLSSTEPLSNEYNGQQYYMLPMGFVNVLYVFYDDAFYLTISQLSMNRLIDAHNESGKAALSDRLERGFAHTGTAHNIVAALDLEKVATFEMGQDMNFWGYRVGSQFAEHHNTLREAMTLAKTLPDFDGTLNNVDGYFHNLPELFYGARFDARDGELYLVAGQERTLLTDIVADRRGEILNAMLEQSLSNDELRSRLADFRSLVLGMSFISEGLEVKLSIGNPDVTAADSRFAFGESGTGGVGGASNDKLWMFLGGAVLLLIVIYAVTSRRRGQTA